MPRQIHSYDKMFLFQLGPERFPALYRSSESVKQQQWVTAPADCSVQAQVAEVDI